MYIDKISLLSFRNIKKENISLSNGINILFGDNAQGKTNVLESIYICATGRSHRTRIDNQLIMFNEKEAHIQIYIKNNNRTDRIDAHIKKEDKKGIAVNGIPIKKSADLFGTLFVVIFSPEDLQLIKNAPSERRRFLDLEICQISSIYYYDLQQYYKVLKQRNNLLKKIQKDKGLTSTLFIWDKQLVDYGVKIIEKRRNFIGILNDLACKKHSIITNNNEKLKLEYKPNVEEIKFEKKLAQNIDRDIFIGNTSAGPHKDDLLFFINNEDVKVYGSQGQQRTAAISTKLAEIDMIIKETGHTPVCLLDDIFSELDESRQKYLMESVKNIQTIITCTGIEDSIKKYIDESFLFNVRDGVIKKSEKNGE